VVLECKDLEEKGDSRALDRKECRVGLSPRESDGVCQGFALVSKGEQKLGKQEKMGRGKQPGFRGLRAHKVKGI